MKKQLKWYSFRWQIAVVLIIVSGLIWYYIIGRFQHSTGVGPAGPSVSLDYFKKTWSTKNVVLIGLGDSITDGYGASKKHNYFELLIENDDFKYPDMKGRDLKHVFPNLQYFNYSISYTVSQEHLKQQIPRVGIYKKNVKGIIVITTGGNDLIHDYGRSTPRDGAMYGCTYEQALKWKDNFKNRLTSIIDGIKNKFPGGCEIFVSNVYDPTDEVGDIENANIMLPKWKDGLKSLLLFNETISKVCSSYKGVHLVDIYSEFLGHGIHCTDKNNKYYRKKDPYYWYFENLEDPNDRGYDAIRRLFLLEMVKVFNK